MAVGDPTGADLASGTTNGDTLPNWGSSWENREISFGAGVTLTSGVTYAIVMRAPDAVPNDTVYWAMNPSGVYVGGKVFTSGNSGGTWSAETAEDNWFQTKASAVIKDSHTNTSDFDNNGADDVDWVAQTFTASEAYTITSVILRLAKWPGSSPGTVTVGIRALEGPDKVTTPAPTDDQENLLIAGKDQLKLLQWSAPAGETPDYLVYFRAEGGAWVLQETITNDSTSHTLSTTVLDALAYYSIYEWRVDTRDPNTMTVTTGDTWTFITTYAPGQWTQYPRRSDYDADKVWLPGTGWVDINTFEGTGGGRFKGRVLVVGHKVIYFGDL